MFANASLTGSKSEQYRQLAEQARGLLHGERDRIANAANLSALVYHALPALNWVGFYFWDGAELVVGPFQGQPACVRIALGRGVCGTAAASRQTQRVPDVEAFPGHIPCDSASRSELVVPLYRGEQLVGVFDLDSPELDRFDDEDQTGLETLATIFLESLT
ncbi:GAF domain-containing protein [Arenimonas oryziterrae]|uniref:Diguanylate cyclase n=1 Tax=Arenimonas oryziterrae DSM 21050 = YC6267 TaxID=1121015 RepID=A0A091ATS2_9GAMM|nr:GAF domain-containing protein [Arenimonas oryziterrae]KFN42399.1 diguanylate cyclase [Arenimonas oryziterrae DSM 21050 = YC6267]